MDLGGFNWTLLTIIGPLVLAVVIIVAVLRNPTGDNLFKLGRAAGNLLPEKKDDKGGMPGGGMPGMGGMGGMEM